MLFPPKCPDEPTPEPEDKFCKGFEALEIKEPHCPCPK